MGKCLVVRMVFYSNIPSTQDFLDMPDVIARILNAVQDSWRHIINPYPGLLTEVIGEVAAMSSQKLLLYINVFLRRHRYPAKSSETADHDDGGIIAWL